MLGVTFSLSTLSTSGPGFRILINGLDMTMQRKDNNTETAHAKLHATANVYLMHTKRSPTLSAVAAAAVDFDDPVWSEHRRLGHLGPDGMRKLLKISDGSAVTDKQIQVKIHDIYPICNTTQALYRIPRNPLPDLW
jgi:hypothetical protein